MVAYVQPADGGDLAGRFGASQVVGVPGQVVSGIRALLSRMPRRKLNRKMPAGQEGKKATAKEQSLESGIPKRGISNRESAKWHS